VHILYGGHSLADPRGGGELSARSLLVQLGRHHRIETVGVGRSRRDYLLDEGTHCSDFPTRLLPPPVGLPFQLAAMCVEARFRSLLRDRLRAQPPDLVILQQPGAVDPSDLPADTRLVVFLRSLACFGAGDPTPAAWRRMAGAPFRSVRFARNRSLLDRADLVISNSRFLQHALREHAGVESHVVPPFIDTRVLVTQQVGAERTCLTFVGLDAWKGASLAIRLAEALPERSFLFLDGPRSTARWRERADRLGNVTRAGWTPDMAPVLNQTRILLMPSLWEEPFGRLPVEAGACGVPTIASARGGLPESVGDGGILIDGAQHLSRWIESIVELDDREPYERLSEAARRHAASFDLDVTLRRFGELVQRELAMELWV
jgi:glycosyltransferase involved in cell wall biosynthesis